MTRIKISREQLQENQTKLAALFKLFADTIKDKRLAEEYRILHETDAAYATTSISFPAGTVEYIDPVGKKHRLDRRNGKNLTTTEARSVELGAIRNRNTRFIHGNQVHTI